MKTIKKFVLALVGISLGCTVQLQAFVVNNPSFENSAPGSDDFFHGSYLLNPSGTTQMWKVTPDGGNTYVYNPSSTSYTGATDTAPGSGVEGQIGGLGVPAGVFELEFAGTLSKSAYQKTAATLQPGMDYDLSVAVGHNKVSQQAYGELRLRLGDSVDGNSLLTGALLGSLAIPANSIPQDTFQTLILHISAAQAAPFLSSWQGTNLVVEVYADVTTKVNGQFGQLDIDNVVFVPEPTTVALLGLGGLLLLRRRTA